MVGDGGGIQVGLTMAQKTTNIPETDIINPNYILLYTFSTIISVRNIYLVQDICAYDAGEELRAYTNVEHQYFNYTANIMMLEFKVFYNKRSLVNILSFAAVMRKFGITIDTALYPAINVNLNYGTTIIFNKCSRVIYYFDTTNMEHKIINSQVTDYTFLNTVQINKAYLQQSEIKGSDKSRILQQIVGW